MKRTSTLLIGIFLLAAAMLASPVAAQDCVEPPAGLVSWWPADGNADDVFAGHNGTIFGGMGFEPGMVGDAFSVDGVDDSVEAPNTGGVFDLVSQWTTHVWVFPKATAAGASSRLVVKESRVGNRNTFELRWGLVDCPPGVSTFAAHLERASDDRDFYVCAQDHPPGFWYHVVGVYDGNDLIIYVDGVEEGRMTVGFVVSYTSPDPLSIGSKFSGAVFDGLIEEVALWNRGLSAEEVKTIFDAGSAGMCQPVPPPTPEELLQRIEALEAELAEQADHLHTYRTGIGEGHNNTEAETGAAEVPEE